MGKVRLYSMDWNRKQWVFTIKWWVFL
jgi:hypothetical protein